MSESVEYDIEIHTYNRPKKPKMPHTAAVRTVLPLKLLAHKVVSKQSAEETDFALLQAVLQKPECAEYNGYNVFLTRNQG